MLLIQTYYNPNNAVRIRRQVVTYSKKKNYKFY